MEAIRDYIAKDSPFYARRFIERVFDHVDKLSDFAEMGRLVPEAKERQDIRELIFQGYRIIYLITDKEVDIISVIHGSNDLSHQVNQP